MRSRDPNASLSSKLCFGLNASITGVYAGCCRPPMKSLFGWHASASTSHEDRRASRNAGVNTRHAKNSDRHSHCDQQELAMRFWRICGGSPEAHAFLQPLMGITTLMQEALRIQNGRAHPPLSQLAALVEFFAVSDDSSQHLNFALSAHADPKETEMHLSC